MILWPALAIEAARHVPKAYALEQLQNIHRSLADDWLYICITPNRLDGPHDVS